MNDSPTPAAGALEFFQALHRRFDETLHRHAGLPSLSDALLSLAFDTFDGNVEIQCEDEPALDCRPGCATCCTLRVAAAAPEVLIVARFLRTVQPRLAERGVDLIASLRDADSNTRGKNEPTRMAQRQRCPFIALGRCVIYRVRPLACRGHASHSARACADAAAGRASDVPYSEGHRMVRALVQNSMQSSLRMAGLAWSLYEFNHAVLIALDRPDAQTAWLAGEDPLAAATLTDIPAEEMAATFDKLRPQ